MFGMSFKPFGFQISGSLSIVQWLDFVNLLILIMFYAKINFLHHKYKVETELVDGASEFRVSFSPTLFTVMRILEHLNLMVFLWNFIQWHFLHRHPTLFWICVVFVFLFSFLHNSYDIFQAFNFNQIFLILYLNNKFLTFTMTDFQF